MTTGTATTLAAGRSQLQVSLRRPAFRGLLGLNALLGLVGATTSTALHGLSPGTGVFGGATQGFSLAIAVWPVTAALSVGALSCDRRARQVGECLLVCGQSLRRQAGQQVAVAVLVGLVATLAALPAGALVGLGDAVRQNGGYLGLTQTTWPPLAPALPATLYLIVLAAALAAAVRTAPRFFGTLIVTALLFLTALPLAGQYADHRLRALCAATPLGPLWSLVYDGPDRNQFSLPMADWQRVAVVLGWLIVSGVVFSLASRPRRGR